MTADTRPAYLTPPEVARLLRMRQATVVSWIRSGRLPAIDISEGRRPRYRISTQALDEYLAGRAVTPPTRPARRERLSVPRYV
ncbi:MAG: helix-turn-helix domain-containing protein [Rhodopirellula sp.]|nr:helix-turn-helix domain-containing protein [Rhodopirellula sp.]